MKLRIIALLLSLLLCLSVFAGCSSSAPAASSATPAATPAPSEAAPATTAAQPSATASAEPVVYELPLTDEEATFGVWSVSPPPFLKNYLGADGDYNTADSTQYVAEKTGVRINYISVDMFAQTEKFNLMVASGDYPDMVSGLPSLYSGGAEQALSDGVIMDLTDYVNNDMPAYMQAIEKSNTKKELLNDDGKYLTISGINDENVNSRGPTFRKDWLDKLGMAVPTTYDEWYEVGKAFKANFDCSMAFYFTKSLNPGATFSGGFDLPGFDITGIGTHFYQIDGKVQSAYVSDNLKDYLQLLRKWYSEGLLDKDFYSADNGPSAEDDITKGNTGAYFENANFVTQYNTQPDLKAQGFHAVGAPVTVKEKGQVTHFSTSTTGAAGINGLCISSSCENTELLIDFLDWLFTKDGQMISNYGIEGKSYTLDQSGNPQWIEKLYTTEGSTFMQMSGTYVFANMPSYFDASRNDSITLDSDGVEALKLFNEGFDGTYDMPTSLKMTTDETTTFYNHITDVDTYAAEYFLKCVTGEADIDATWKDYVAKLDELGLQACIEVKQSSYDRYFTRGS